MSSLPLFSAESPDTLPGGSADTDEARTQSGRSGQPALHVKAAGGYPPAGQQAPQGRAEGFGVPPVFCTPQVLESCRIIKQAAGEAHYPLVFSATQMKHMERALVLAIDDAIEAMSEEPHGRHEIQPNLDAYTQIRAALKQAKAARAGHGGANEDWRGDML